MPQWWRSGGWCWLGALADECAAPLQELAGRLLEQWGPCCDNCTNTPNKTDPQPEEDNSTTQ